MQNIFNKKWLPKPKREKNKINNNRSSIIGPSFSGKTYLILRKLKLVINRDKFVITRTPEQFIVDFKVEEGNRETRDFEAGIVVSGGLLD